MTNRVSKIICDYLLSSLCVTLVRVLVLVLTLIVLSTGPSVVFFLTSVLLVLLVVPCSTVQ
jgi:hypothetical protein